MCFYCFICSAEKLIFFLVFQVYQCTKDSPSFNSQIPSMPEVHVWVKMAVQFWDKHLVSHWLETLALRFFYCSSIFLAGFHRRKPAGSIIFFIRWFLSGNFSIESKIRIWTFEWIFEFCSQMKSILNFFDFLYNFFEFLYTRSPLFPFQLHFSIHNCSQFFTIIRSLIFKCAGLTSQISVQKNSLTFADFRYVLCLLYRFSKWIMCTDGLNLVLIRHKRLSASRSLFSGESRMLENTKKKGNP